jgi:hypothetical protein
MGMPNNKVQVSDLNEPIFAGAENINITNLIKIVNRVDTVNYPINLLFKLLIINNNAKYLNLEKKE